MMAMDHYYYSLRPYPSSLPFNLFFISTILLFCITFRTAHCKNYTPPTAPPLLTPDNQKLDLWPMPANVSFGDTTLPVLNGFLFTAKSPGDQPIPQTLSEAFGWYTDLIFKPYANQIPKSTRPDQDTTSFLRSLVVDLDSTNETLKFGTNESYVLQVPDPNNSSAVYLKAKTVYGALRGLETFSQLCVFNFSTEVFEVQKTPWTITDYPRFPYRGLLIDTARHYQPVSMIKEVIDAMSHAKLNVLHWHFVDTQSFSLEVPSYPRLWNGSFTQSERYTIADARDIVQYAQRRGVHVMAELDVPGHAESWGVGYPMLWPSSQCREPLDVSKQFTFNLIDGVISDFSKVFTFDFMHLGGDEVDTGCWTETPEVNEWLKKGNLTESDAYKGFVLKAASLARSHGYTPVNWEETFNSFQNALDKTTVVHNWLGRGAAPSIVKAGYRCIVSDQDAWYLDHLETSWEEFYKNEPLAGISNPDEQKLVLGGEVCMWGETVDESNIQQTIWPRAAAAAERLWSLVSQIPDDISQVQARLQNFRCLLTRRGIAAAPVLVNGRQSPDGPGSCFIQ